MAPSRIDNNRSSLALALHSFAKANGIRKRRSRGRPMIFNAYRKFMQHWRIGMSMFFSLILLICNSRSEPVVRVCRRYPRMQGWWTMVWTMYSDKRFKENFQVTKATFLYILDAIKDDLTKQTVAENPVPPPVRLAVCLYRLGRGDYLHTIGELAGLGKSTVYGIVKEVSEAIVSRMWQKMVVCNMPKSLENLKETMTGFEEQWQFPCCFGAVDGCHLPIKCPNGGLESAKEYHNFKNFFSIVLMAIADSNYRFIWASSGYLGNSHDAIIFQSTKFYSKMLNQTLIPHYYKEENDNVIYPTLLGDSAFPFLPWLMKPYTNTVLTREQRYFNYRLSRARMVAEGAFGQLKGRWRILMRKNECNIETLRLRSHCTIFCWCLDSVGDNKR